MEEHNIDMTQPQQPMDERDLELQAMRARIAELEQRNRKKGKVWKRILIVLGAIVAVFVIVGIVLFAISKTDKESPAMAEAVLQAVIAGDSSSAYGLMYPGLITEAEFTQGFDEICALWRAKGGGSEYEIKQTGWSLNIKNGIKQYTVHYTVTSGDARFTLQIMRAEQGELSGMVGAHLSMDLPRGQQ